MVQPNTHLRASRDWVGAVVEIDVGRAVASLATSSQMAVDDHGLVHGGFVFGLADYAAMLAVNDPNVVLGAAEVRFVAPVAVGDTVVATAVLDEVKGRKHTVSVVARAGVREVFTGTFTTFVLDEHVLGASS